MTRRIQMTSRSCPRQNFVALLCVMAIAAALSACQAPAPGSNLSADAASPTASTVAASPTATTVPAASPSPSPVSPVPTPVPPADIAAAADGGLLIPVSGITFEQLQNTFKDARSGGRVHDAIDIIAPRGTPVVACTDGRIAKLFRSERGGITLYQLAPDERTVYYYAHLDRYADNIAVGNFLRRGDVLGYVGDTGNATPGNYHLHFAVSRVANPRNLHNGEYLNPYDLFGRK